MSDLRSDSRHCPKYELWYNGQTLVRMLTEMPMVLVGHENRDPWKCRKQPHDLVMSSFGGQNAGFGTSLANIFKNTGHALPDRNRPLLTKLSFWTNARKVLISQQPSELFYWQLSIRKLAVLSSRCAFAFYLTRTFTPGPICKSTSWLMNAENFRHCQRVPEKHNRLR